MIRRLLVAALFALALIAPAVTTAAPAPLSTPDCCNVVPIELEIYYYSDATYTVQVGFRYENRCTLQQWMDGVETPYYKRFRAPCNA